MTQFSLNETALAKDGPLLYEAKIKKLAVSEFSATKYFIHYQGWKQKFDTWVTEDCLLKYTTSNLQLQKKLKSELEENEKEKKLSRKRRTKSLPNTSLKKGLKRTRKSLPNVNMQNCMSVSIVCKKLKVSEDQMSMKLVTIPLKKTDEDPLALGNDFSVENPNTITENVSTSELGISYIYTNTEDGNQSDSMANPSTKYCNISPELTSSMDNDMEKMWNNGGYRGDLIPIPEELKNIINNNYDILKGKQRALILPANPSIAKLLQNYIEHIRLAMPEEDTSDREQFVQGVEEYFNVLVDKQLLYKFEKKRNAEIRKAYKNTPMSHIYGAIHLVRMVAEISPYLIEAIKDDNSMQLMIFHFCELLKYIRGNPVLLNEDMYGAIN